MKTCPYCLAKHERKRATFCCDEHAERWQHHNASVQSGRKRATEATLRRIHDRAANASVA